MLIIICVIVALVGSIIIFRQARDDFKRINEVGKERSRVIDLIGDISQAQINLLRQRLDNIDLNLEEWGNIERDLDEEFIRYKQRWILFDEIDFNQMVDAKHIPVEDFYARIDWLNARKF